MGYRTAPGAHEQRASAAELVTGRYRLQEQLGSGGMGSVHRAVDEGSGRTVALKLLRSAGKAQRELFRREFATLAKLAHPCVIEVFDHGQDDAGHLYYTMELLSGSDLMNAAPLPWRAACEALRDVATSLALLHSQRLVHRDINPRNVRLVDGGRAKLIDFGALSPFGLPRELVGTPSCIAPEALRGAVLDARTDLFSLGVVAYWTLTKRLPYAVASFPEAEAAWQTQPLPASTYVSAIPVGLDELLLSLLSVEPQGRPTSAADVIDRLSALAALDDGPLWSLAKSHVTSATLVGRERELTQCHDILSAAQGGHGTLLCVAGGHGTGKTRFLGELAILAQLQGFTTVQLSLEEPCDVEPLLRKLLSGLRESMPRETLGARLYAASSLAHLTSGPPDESAPAQNAVATDHFEHERALRMQLAVGGLISQLSAQRSILITIDDTDNLSDRARTMLPILAHAALDHTLVVAVARASAAGSPSADNLEPLGTSITLSDLDDQALDTLLQSIFGDVPNRARLGAWLQRTARGNPGLIRDCLLSLLERRIVRYGGGAWLVPPEFGEIQLPEHFGAASSRELAELTPETRELLRILACHHGPLPHEVCLRVMPEATHALEAAVQRRLVVVNQDGVRLAQAATRSVLRAEISVAQRSAIHGKLASVFAQLYERPVQLVRQGNVGNLSVDEITMAIQTGLHLLRSDRERDARLLLRNGAVALTVRGQGLARVAPALEDAVTLYREAGVPVRSYAGMMTTLTLAGTYADWRLSYRYAEDTLDACADAAGLPWAERLAPYVGKRVAIVLSIVVAFLLFFTVPRRRVASSFKAVLLGLTGLGTGALAVCSVMMDPARAQRLVARLRPLGFFPRKHPLREIHEYQLALQDHARGRYTEGRQRGTATLAYLRSEAALKDFPESARLQLEAGVLIAHGQLDASRTDGAIDVTLRDIQRVQTATTQQTYCATMMSMHANRGERAAYLQWRERTDQLAAAEGATWRNDIQVPRMIWSTHALCEDVLTLKRDMEQLTALAAQVPTVARLRDLLSACYLCERGQPAEALAQYESVFQLAQEEQGVRAAQQLGAYARILRKAGRAQAALQVCEDALARLTPGDLEFSLLVFGLQFERAVSLTALGHMERSKHAFSELLAAHASHDNPMLHGLLHAARAEAAMSERDWTTFEEHASAAERWFNRTQHPSLMAQYQRLMERARASVNEQTLSQVLAGNAVSPFGTTQRASAIDPTFETEDIV